MGLMSRKKTKPQLSITLKKAGLKTKFIWMRSSQLKTISSRNILPSYKVKTVWINSNRRKKNHKNTCPAESYSKNPPLYPAMAENPSKLEIYVPKKCKSLTIYKPSARRKTFKSQWWQTEVNWIGTPTTNHPNPHKTNHWRWNQWTNTSLI